MTKPEPWANDKFNRQQNANDLIAYIQSVHANGMLSGEEKSQVIAVDAAYGIGKTFFLRAMAEELSEDHAVAYVDAWADDFINEPIVSIAATLRDAIEPWLPQSRVKEQWNETAKKAGKIALIAGKGFGKQALKFVITGGAVEGIEAVWDGEDATDMEAVKEAVKDSVDQADGDVAEALAKLSEDRFLDKKIAQLQEARSAISNLKGSLSGLANVLKENDVKLPIYVIIDELDRCRPDYAIKLLEEIKHLFSVPDVVFILGVNSEQLSKSITAEYGAGFDGQAYLRRFIDRQYNLPYPEMSALVDFLYNRAIVPSGKEMWFPPITRLEDKSSEFTQIQWITELLKFYRLSPRDAFAFFDWSRTALALIADKRVMSPYIFELIAQKLALQEITETRPWQFMLYDPHGRHEWIDGHRFFVETKAILGLRRNKLREVLNRDGALENMLITFALVGSGSGVVEYPSILDRVGKFSASEEVD